MGRMPKTLRSREHKVFQTLLRDARREADVTQSDLALRLDRPQSFVAKYENGERRIDVVEFVEIARALRLQPVRFFERIIEALDAVTRP
jgi:transcriptional regulator with XRE-family HTH domain